MNEEISSAYKKMQETPIRAEDIKEEVIDFLVAYPNPTPKLIKNWASEINVPAELIITVIASLATTFVRFWKGGKSNEVSADFKYNEEQLAMGRIVEMEHTPDVEVAEKITKDHLAEFSDEATGKNLENIPQAYYTLLEEMEAKMKDSE